MHSNNLELKNTLFFKLEIQEKIVEMVGMLPLEEPLPINGSLIEEMLREEGHDDPDEDEYEDEVKYFVVETDRLVKKSVEKTICKELGSVFGCEIAVKSEAWRGEQRLQTLFLSVETNKQAATITTYKFLMENSNLAITLYPTTKPLKDLLPQSSFQVAQILLEIATKHEYSGLKIVSILCSNNVLTVCLQLGETIIHGRLSIPKILIPNKKKPIFNPRQLQCQLKVKIMKSIIQNLLRQPQDIQIECNSQADHSEAKESEILYECYQLLTFKKEVMLTHELYQTYGIVCQWMRKNRYNTFLFSTAKEKLYIRKIVQLVTQALQTQSPEMQQLRPYLTKITKQHNPKQIITTFTSLFNLIATDYRSELQNPCSSRL